MSDNWMHFFPAGPQLLKPDWTDLRGKLVDCGFIIEPRGADIPADTIRSLWEHIAKATGATRPNQAPSAGLDDVIDLLSRAGFPLDRWALDTSHLTVPDFIAELRGAKVLPEDFVFMDDERYQPGPLFATLCDVPHARYGWSDTYVYPQDFGDEIGVEVGENMLIPPGIPGTDRVFEDWGPFLELWIKDPAQRWTDPETGKQYGLLDFDWENSLAAGKFMLSVFSPGYLDGDRVARLLGELTGQRFLYSRQHI